MSVMVCGELADWDVNDCCVLCHERDQVFHLVLLDGATVCVCCKSCVHACAVLPLADQQPVEFSLPSPCEAASG